MPVSKTPDARHYWQEQMDAADRFMKEIFDHPVEDNLEPLHDLTKAVASSGLEVYFASHPHVQGLPRLYYLRQQLIDPFLATAEAFNQQGWAILVEDAYRTSAMQRGLTREESIFRKVFDKVVWECHGQVPPIPLLLRRLGALVAVAPKVGTHQSGSALDISVLDRRTGKLVDRGGPYLELSEKTPMDSPFISTEAQDNRKAITALFKAHGFYAYPYEFWHYSAGDAYAQKLSGSEQAAAYGAVQLDQQSGQVSPVPDPQKGFVNQADLERSIAALYRSSPRGG